MGAVGPPCLNPTSGICASGAVARLSSSASGAAGQQGFDGDHYETALSGCSASGAANPALRGCSATGAASASLPDHDGHASISDSVQQQHTQHCASLTRMNAVNTWMRNKMRAQVQDTSRTAPSATMQTQFKLVFAQRHARLVGEQRSYAQSSLLPRTD